MKIEIPDFNTKKELFDFLIKNKQTLIAQKMNIIKQTDCFNYVNKLYDKNDVVKDVSNINLSEATELNTILVMNTCNIIDSHLDLHVAGLWNKTLKENKMLMHIQEHSLQFDKIISEGKDLKALTKKMAWTELGFAYEGSTEALIFKSKIRKERNEFMFNQYGKGYVKNHSVGMRYIKILMAINDENYTAEYEAWEKYYPKAVNPEVADGYGYFWIVKEAKLQEGSAVPLGSNIATPTLEVKTITQEPFDDTQKNEPINYEYLTKNFLLT